MSGIFLPQGDTLSITITGTSAASPIPSRPVGGGTLDLCLSPAAPITFIKLGNSTVTVTASNGLPIKEFMERTVAFGESTHIAVIGTSGTLYVTTGS